MPDEKIELVDEEYTPEQVRRWFNQPIQVELQKAQEVAKKEMEQIIEAEQPKPKSASFYARVFFIALAVTGILFFAIKELPDGGYEAGDAMKLLDRLENATTLEEMRSLHALPSDERNIEPFGTTEGTPASGEGEP